MTLVVVVTPAVNEGVTPWVTGRSTTAPPAPPALPLATMMPASSLNITTLTTTTTTGVDQVVGTIELEVGDPDLFFGPEANTVRQALTKAVATMAGVNETTVNVTLRRLSSRRLGQLQQEVASRRLQGGGVAVDYTIAMPGDEVDADAPAPTMASVAASLAQTDIAAVTSAVSSELADAGITVAVSVTSIVATPEPATVSEPALATGTTFPMALLASGTTSNVPRQAANAVVPLVALMASQAVSHNTF